MNRIKYVTVAAVPVVKCACGCEQEILAMDKCGKSRRFEYGHSQRGIKRPWQVEKELQIGKVEDLSIHVDMFKYLYQLIPGQILMDM